MQAGEGFGPLSFLSGTDGKLPVPCFSDAPSSGSRSGKRTAQHRMSSKRTEWTKHGTRWESLWEPNADLCIKTERYARTNRHLGIDRRSNFFGRGRSGVSLLSADGAQEATCHPASRPRAGSARTGARARMRRRAAGGRGTVDKTPGRYRTGRRGEIEQRPRGSGLARSDIARKRSRWVRATTQGAASVPRPPVYMIPSEARSE